MNAIDVAVKMETDAISFYNEAASKVQSNVGRKMFLSIVEDEKRHLAILTDILKGIDITIRDVSPIKNIKTVFEEMRHEMMERVKATDDELNAFKIAMDIEKEGIEFYKKALSEDLSPKEKNLFERLIKEEEQHYAVFSNTYFFMKQSGSWFMWEEHSIVDGGTPWA